MVFPLSSPKPLLEFNDFAVPRALYLKVNHLFYRIPLLEQDMHRSRRVDRKERSHQRKKERPQVKASP